MDTTPYGPLVAALLKEPGRPPLGPGSPNEAMRPQLEQLTAAEILAPATVHDADMGKCCLAALWLHHDCLDESHKLSQDIATPTGSYWHAILHRREPDYDNAKYWFRRVGQHPVFEPLHRTVRAWAAQEKAADFLAQQPTWDPFAFVDFCAQCQAEGGANADLAQRIQQREWQLLFDYCYRQAGGGQG